MNWPMVSLGDVAEIQGGIQKQPKRSPQRNAFPFLRVANVTAHGLNLKEIHAIELFDGELERYRLRQGDLLVVEGNGSASQIGRAAVWDGSIKDAVHQNHLIRVRPGCLLNERFLSLFWNSPSNRAELARIASSTSGLHTLSVAKLKRIMLPLPPPNQQRRIIEILEDHLSRLDAAESYLHNALKNLKALKASVLASLHAGEPLSLGALSVDSGYGTSEKCVPNGAGAAVVRIPNLVDGQIDLSDEKRVLNAEADVSAYMLAPGDVLIVRTNGSIDLIGRSAVVQPGIDAAFASYLIRYRVRDEVVRPRWVQIMLSTPQVRGRIESLAASSAGQHNLSLGKLDQLELPVPSTAVQDAGIQRIVGIELDVSRLAVSLAAARSRTARLRSSILDATFSGRLAALKSDSSLNEELIDA